MPRKPVRGRFSIVVPLEGGGSWSCESFKEKSLTAREVADCLREYAGFIETHFLSSESPQSVDAVARPDGISND